MKYHLLKYLNSYLIRTGLFLSLLWLFPSMDLEAQCDPQLSGDASVCSSSQEIYTVVRGEAGSTLSWSLLGGGSITALNADNSEATIDWGNADGGPYFIIVTENGLSGCSATTQMQVVVEKSSLSLACNDMVNVALDHNCQATITPDMLLEDPAYEDDSYAIHLSDSNGTPIPGNVVDITYLNEIITVTVEHLCSGQTCWGKISVQDNVAPGLECRPDVIEVACDESIAPEDIGFPLPFGSTINHLGNNEYSVSVPGECGGAYNLVYSDELSNLNCGDNYDFTITRTWVATDSAGNSTQCDEVIGALWGSLSNMTLPPHYDGITTIPNHLPVLQCSFAHLSTYWPYDYNPGPDVTGFPEWSGCSNIQYYYEDVVFNLCGNGRKIVRHWLILDWCTGQDLVYDQLIIIEDNAPPIVTAVRDTLYYPTLDGKCYGTAYPIPAPNVLFDCSDWEYTISYKLRDEFGNPFEQSITDNVFEGPEGFGITNLPVDTTWVMYTITDACGNETLAFTEIVVEDYEAPTAVCEKHTVVTLTADGTAKIFANSVDDGSNDNCGLDRFEIRRMDTPCGYPEDLEFGESVNFCCEDAGKTVILVFRAWDLKGYFSDCMVEVKVQDKMLPVIDCPANVTLQCGQDYNNLNLTGGEPEVFDNCDNVTLTKTDIPNLGDCGTGYITRRWKAVDGSGEEVKCTQIIYIEDSNPLTYDDIDWPADITLPGCTALNADPDVTGEVVINNEACKDIGIGYTDIVSDNAPGVCLEILREWKVIDWCEDPPFTYITHTQVIRMSETDDPYFTSCEDIVVDSENANCDALVTVKSTAKDDCTDDDHLTYTWEIDYDRDGQIDENGVGDSFSRNFPHGRHWVYFTVYDGCGNEETCRLTVRVRDIKDPTPLCLAKVTTTMMQTGMLPVTAGSFNLCNCSGGSFDNCTPNDQLRFSFSPDVNDVERLFTCDDIPNGVAESFELQVYVTDLDGNQDFCNVTLVIMDNVDACIDDPNASASLSGFIMDPSLTGMPEFEVQLEKDSSVTIMETTNEEGLYAFDNLDVYSRYKLQPKRDVDPANGVSTLDLVLIQKHILGLLPLESPYKLIAADANRNGAVTAGDILDIRSLILGLTNDFPENDSWRFIQGQYEFDDPFSPWDFEEKFIVDELYIDSDSINFIGIKVGDVNNSAAAEIIGNSVESRSTDKMLLSTSDIEMKKGATKTIPVRIQEDQWLAGFQFTLDYNAELVEIHEVNSEVINLNKLNINYFDGENGKLTISWNQANASHFSAGSILFNIELKAKSYSWLSESMEISSSYTQAEAYDEELNLMDIELRFENQKLQAFTVYQNMPNPFAENTDLRFYNPADSYIQLSVYDANGKVIKQMQGHYSKGMHTITLEKDLFGYYGIYFYKITNDDKSVVHKMIYSR